MNPNLLNNLRILDFTWVLSGPFATRLLADFGAEVIKIQSLVTSRTPDSNKDPYFCTWNRNKKSICLNMGKEEGRELFFDLVKISDVVVDNFSPHVMEKWGIDYELLKSINPKIIMAQISAGGHSGPLNDISGFGPGIQAMSGFTSLTSYSTSEPIGAGYAYADHIMGLQASSEILNAVYNRDLTGIGSYIDISGIDAMKSVVDAEKEEYSRCILCMDGSWCAVSPKNEKEKELAENIAQNCSASELAERLQLLGVAAHKVYDSRDLFSDEHLSERNFLSSIKNGQKTMLTDRCPVSAASCEQNFRPAPEFGESNEYVFKTLLNMPEKLYKDYIRREIIF